MAEDLGKIKQWLKAQEIDDPISRKSEDRVFTQVAKGIRRTNPLPRGACHLCAAQVDRLVPVVMKVCPACLNLFLKRGGLQRIIKREFARWDCDNCLGMTLTVITINPLVCVKCSTKIGHRHDPRSDQSEALSALKRKLSKKYTFIRP